MIFAVFNCGACDDSGVGWLLGDVLVFSLYNSLLILLFYWLLWGGVSQFVGVYGYELGVTAFGLIHISKREFIRLKEVLSLWNRLYFEIF